MTLPICGLLEDDAAGGCGLVVGELAQCQWNQGNCSPVSDYVGFLSPECDVLCESDTIPFLLYDGVDEYHKRAAFLHHPQMAVFVEEYIALMDSMAGTISGPGEEGYDTSRTAWAQRVRTYFAELRLGCLPPANYSPEETHSVGLALGCMTEILTNKAKQLTFVRDIFNVYMAALKAGEPTTTLCASLDEGLDDFRELHERLQATCSGAMQQLEVVQQKRKRVVLPQPATNSLKQWFDRHLAHPYPSEKEKSLLATSNGITPLQVQNWFINQRKRFWGELRR